MVLLAESSGGSGTFVHVAVFSDVAGGGHRNVATRLLGDRVHVTALRVRARQVHVDFAARVPGRGLAEGVTEAWQLADGRLVDTIHRGPLPAGESSFTWQGRDRNGRAVASGSYFLRLTGPGVHATARAVLLR